LIFAAGKVHIIQSGTVQTVKNISIPNGTCGSNTSIFSSISGSNTTFNKTGSGAITIHYVLLKDINATGGTFNALNSISLANTTGWNITAPVNSSGSYYWIGDSGSWSDLNHWSSSSNGPANQSCLPGPGNNVIFDNNSFHLANQTVNIDVSTAYCNSLICSGNLRSAYLAGNSDKCLQIFGSLTFNSNILFTFFGKTIFSSGNAGNTITMAGSQFQNQVTFSGSGAWTLQDAFVCNSTLNFFNGSLTTNNMPFTIDALNSAIPNNRTLILGNSLLTVTANSYSGFSIDFTNFNFDAGTSTICFNYNNGYCTPGILSYVSPNDIHFYNVTFTGTYCTGYILNYTGKQFFFNNVSFTGNAYVQGNNTYNGILLFSPGTTCKFVSGQTQTINGNLSANGSCEYNINLEGTTMGVPAIFKKTSGVVNASFFNIKYVNATGGATWNALNSDNVFSSTGWNTTPPPNNGNDLYFVGHTNNWRSPANWSYTSGGTSNAAGCIPGPSNNVIFDDNSFITHDTVNIDMTQASCKNMIWNTHFTPVLTGIYFNSIHIYGSLSISNPISIPFAGAVYFESTSSNNTIASGGSVFSGPVYFEGAGGTFTLSDSLSCLNKVYLNQGNLNFNNKNVRAAYFNSTTASVRTLNMGASHFTITACDPKAVYLNCVNLQVNANTSSFVFSDNTGGSNGFYIVSANQPVNFNDIIYSGIYSTGVVNNISTETINFHNLTFYGSGIINGSNTFNDVVFHKQGTINSSNNFHILTLTPGNNYILKDSTTQTIQSYFWTQGTCTSYIFLMSSSTGSRANIINSGQQVPGYNLHVRDINYSAPVFIAYNSVNLGNNSGISFQTLPAMSNLQSIVGPASVCKGSIAAYSIPSVAGAIYYHWSYPGGDTIISGQGDTLVHIQFDTVTTANISVAAWNGCSFNTPSVLTITVNPKPLAEAGPNQSICKGSSTTLTATGGDIYHWTTGSASSIINVSPVFTTTYTVTITNATTGCSAKDSVIIFVNYIFANAGNDQTMCSGSSVTLNATGGVSYSWSPAANVDDMTISNPEATPATTTIFTVTVTGSNGCSATDNVVVTVTPMPIANAGVDVQMCAGSNAVLQATGGTIYHWSNGGSAASVTVAPVRTTSYIVTAYNGVCASSDTVKVIVHPLPTASFTADVREGCGPLEVHFSCTTSPDVITYNWDFGDSSANSTDNFPAHIFNNSDRYDVTLTVTDSNGCQQVITVPQFIFVYPKPDAGFNWKLEHADGSHYIYNFMPATADNVTMWHWHFGDINSAYNTSDESNPKHDYKQAGTYTVTCWVQSAPGCADSLVKEITVEDVSDFFIPNTFTPNNDGLNDVFMPVFNHTDLENYSFTIFNRWGGIVFETNDVSNGWDGSFKGASKPAPEGVYVWIISFKGEKQIAVEKKGTVSLLR